MTARGSRYLIPITAGLAVTLSSTSLSGVLRGLSWLWFVALTVAVVVVIGLALRAVKVPTLLVVPAQLVGLLLLLTGLFSFTPILGFLPGASASGELVAQLGVAVGQIENGLPPVPTTYALALLVSLGFGLVAVAVDPLAMAGHGPAIGGLVQLGAYTVPTALAPVALPGWTLAAGAVGFMLLLMVNHRERQARRGIPTRPPTPIIRGVPSAGQLAVRRVRGALRAAIGAPIATTVTVIAVVAALSISSLFTVIGTTGRFTGGHGNNGNSSGSFGLNPFALLRGQLEQDEPTELLRVRGLPGPEYLRALTLSKYIPQQGWQLGVKRGATDLNGNLPTGLPVPVRNPTALVQFENVGFRDRWLPLFGLPMGVTGVIANRWKYDVITGTAYAESAFAEPRWTERAALPNPDVAVLERTEAATDVDPIYLDTTGIDPRIIRVATAVTAHARTQFDRVIAMNKYFLDPVNGFRYNLRTSPGNSGDALVDFLTQTKTGYCEQFASAMAVMLRTQGIPSRVAVGFTGGKKTDDYHSISTDDAHAWVEAFFPGLGWLRFDPTPLSDGRTVVPSYVADAPNVPIDPLPSPSGPGAPPPNQAAGPTPSSQPDAPSSAEPKPSRDGPDSGEHDPDPRAPIPAPSSGSQGDQGQPQPSGDQGQDEGGDGTGPDDSPGDGGSSSIPAGLLLALGLIGLALLVISIVAAIPAVLRAMLRQRRLRQAARGGPNGAVAAWRELLAEFEDRGGEPAGNDTVRSIAKRLATQHRLDPSMIGNVRTVVGAVECGWYARQSDHRPGSELVSAVTTIRGGLDRSAPLTVAGRVWPRSIRPKQGLRSLVGVAQSQLPRSDTPS